MSRVNKGKGETGKIITPFPPLTHTQDYTIYAKRAKIDIYKAINVDPDQTPHSAASDQDLLCLHKVKTFAKISANTKNKNQTNKTVQRSRKWTLGINVLRIFQSNNSERIRLEIYLLDNFCNFPYAFLYTSPLLKGVYSMAGVGGDGGESKFLPFRREAEQFWRSYLLRKCTCMDSS